MTRAASEMKALSGEQGVAREEDVRELPSFEEERERILSKDLKWNWSLSLVRTLACLGIVLLHTVNVSEMLYRETIGPRASSLSVGIVHCMMWAVPCFLMVSGALLLDPGRDIPLGRIFSQYLRRVFIALLISCVLFRIFDGWMDGEGISLMTVADSVYRMFLGQSWAHLWYLYLLAGLYLMLPFYRMIAAQSADQMMRYLLFLYFLFLSVLPTLRFFGIPMAFEIQTASVYPFYFFFGHAVASRKVRFAASAAVAMAVGGTAAIIVLSAILPYMPEGPGEAVRGLLGSYASIPVVVQSIGIFAFVYGMERSSTGGDPSKSDISSLNWIEALKMADEAGFGIYLIHMLFLRYFLRYLGWNLFELGAWTFIAFALGVYLLSGVLVALLRKASILARFQLSSWISRYDCLQ